MPVSSRNWDYNTQGVAHIGLYPGIYQDLANLGMTVDERREFFGAADAFARMWGQDRGASRLRPLTRRSSGLVSSRPRFGGSARR